MIVGLQLRPLGAIWPPLYKAVRDARVGALSGFRNEVAGGSYPGKAELAGIADAEFEAFRAGLEKD